MKKSGVLKVVIATCALSLVAAHLSPATAAPAAQVITCVDLATGKERISKTDTCRTTEATAKWHLTPTDSALASGGTTKSLTICSNKESSSVIYQIIRAQCARHQIRNLYLRSTALAARPVIAQAVSYGYDSSQITLAQNPATNPDAPIAYYTITSSRGNTQRIYSWKDLSLVISGLQGLTTYTFTVTATTADGTSPVSASSLPVTTPAYVAPVAAATTAPLAAPAFTLSAAAETKTVNTAITGYTISSTGGTIASYAISPAAPTGLTFNATTGLLSGTPTSTQSATAYTITATNATGSATRTFTLTVAAALATPAFTLSSSSETRTVNTAATGFTISSTGGAIASFAISATPAGMSFNTSTGALTGTPTTVAGATAYTITATNATGSATRTFTLTVIAVVVYTVGQTGPGGGLIYYVNAAGFDCGETYSPTGSPTGGKCNYLEVAPSGWNRGTDPDRRWAVSAQVSNDVTSITNDAVPFNDVLGVGLGYRNSVAIVGQGNDITTAAGLARAYTGGGKSDWYLPSAAELNLLCQWVRGVAQSVTTGCSGGYYDQNNTAHLILAGIVNNYYWSSSEKNASYAWYQDLYYYSNAPQSTFFSKSFDGAVRPVRAF